MEEFKKITVEADLNHTVKVKNPTSLKLLGQGGQGAVFKLSQKRCVKIYSDIKYVRLEAFVYGIADGSKIIPKVYEIGPNYIVMEFIDGIPLNEYLKQKGYISESLAKQILFVIKEMKRLKFPRLAIPLRHILVTDKEEIKVIDHVNTFKIRDQRPLNLFVRLKKLGLLEQFLKYVKKLDINLFNEWSISMSEYFTCNNN